MECHKKLTCLRKKQGLTQQELAEAVDVSRQAISKWEAGAATPTVEIKKEIADLKKWMIALVAVVTVLALAVAVYIAGTLLKGSDAIPLDELEQEYVGFSLDGEFDFGW